MPVGLAIGGAVAGVGGALISSGAAKSSANKAAEASERSAELAAQVQREIYGQNKQTLTPFINTGTAAMGQINALLGIPSGAPAQTGAPVTGTPATGTPATGTSAFAGLPAGYADSFNSITGPLGRNDNLTVQQAAANSVNPPSGVNWQQYIQSQPDVAYDYTLHSGMSPEQYGAWHWERDGARRDLNPFMATSTAPGTVTTPAVTQPTAEQAFDAYRNSTGYQFRLGEGMDAINSGYAGRGVLQSGAAMKSIQEYGQNLASAEFSQYLGQLGNQQALGFSGASALAGVGQNYANSMGGIYQQNGENQANAALARGQGGMQIGSALTGFGGQMLGAALNPWGAQGGGGYGWVNGMNRGWG